MLANQSSTPVIKIFLVDDLRVVREKVKEILQPHRDIQIVGIATDGDSAIEQLEYLQPDTILLDLDMPHLDGWATARIISHEYPHIDIIILSSSIDDRADRPAIPSIKEFIDKSNIEDIASKIRAVRDRQPRNRPSQLAVNPKDDRFTLQNSAISRIDRDRFNDNFPSQFVTSIAQTSLTKLNDWSNSAKELIDMMPLPWTRGLLYLLIIFLGITIPWACLYRMDEIGIARGRLEAKGSTLKREADIEGSVAVLKVYVKKGDLVKAGQVIMELDARNVREQISQNQLKLNGEQQQLDRLLAIENQVGLGTSAQQQQNQAQLLEKQSQIAQAQQSLATLAANSHNQIAEKLAQLNQAKQALVDRQSSDNLQKAEKLTQVRQAEQAVVDAQTNHLIAQNRFKDAQNERLRYQRLYETGAISEVKAREVGSVALEKNQLFTQAFASLQQAKLRVKEQRENYQKLLQQGQSDVAQAKLRLKEQQESYQSVIAKNQAEIAQAKLRITEQQRGAQSLTKGGNIAVLKTEQQFKEIQSQIATLKSEIERDRAQGQSLLAQLKKYTIQADLDGTIFDLPIAREGSVVQPKQLLAEIAPATGDLIFKGEIPANQSESLRSSPDTAQVASNVQKDVKLKFDEFPFESYDVVPGKLAWIAPTSKLSQGATGGTVASYDIEVQLGRSCIKHEQRCIPFKSGQPATAEIVIRNRRIIDFILDPFRKLNNGSR
ncbi:response regulator [Chamaesiphon sp. VAR_69_metabat_338]|uniref:response regulator n=1 Tax=Chamaesiphon sp. VAR_69_metabat_338 TaxID=2964704 RepID=UPI00286E3B87|nr:response regulator [Chamaesiphon sp. VAR_69_metabat_338]